MTRLVGKDADSIRQATELIRAGGLVAYPTDTVYGLGCDPFNSDAIDRLARAKERTKGSFPILVDSLSRAQQLGVFSDATTRLAGRFWPGPLTVVVPLKISLPSGVTGDSSTIGLRIPDHEICGKLIRGCNGAIIGTSANLSANPSPTTAMEVLRELKNRIDLIIDGGPAPLGRESTVVRVAYGEVSVLREGASPIPRR